HTWGRFDVHAASRMWRWTSAPLVSYVTGCVLRGWPTGGLAWHRAARRDRCGVAPFIEGSFSLACHLPHSAGPLLSFRILSNGATTASLWCCSSLWQLSTQPGGATASFWA